MSFLKNCLKTKYLSSINPTNKDALLHLSEQMFHYYANSPYHSEWIKGLNSNWQSGVHNCQLLMCDFINEESEVLEVGCGDGSAAKEISKRVKDIKYTGVDLDPNMWKGREDFNFIAAKAEELPFLSASFDVVFSMFVIEHLVFPASFLDEAWRVLKPGGCLIIIAPNFDANAMPSEKIGFSYGSGMAKLAQGKILDAIITAYDTRVRLYLRRLIRKMQLANKDFSFPVLTDPRCLCLPGFTPDCDAVYPVSPKEIINYLCLKDNYKDNKLFYYERSTFGLAISKY